MYKLLISLTTLLFIFGCKEDKSEQKEESKEKITKKNTTAVSDTTPRVVGIGGIFFFSDNPAETGSWYKKHLGMESNAYGHMFQSRNIDNPDQKEILQWTPFKKGSDYFAPSKKEFMINYIVNNLEGLVKKLKVEGVTIVDSIETFDYGKFIHIMDNEGNKIELWEPNYDYKGE